MMKDLPPHKSNLDRLKWGPHRARPVAGVSDNRNKG